MKPNILLISPHAEVYEPFRTVLEKEGFSVTTTDLLHAATRSPLNAQFSLVVVFSPSLQSNGQNPHVESPTIDALFLLHNHSFAGTIQSYRNGLYRLDADRAGVGKFVETVKELLLEQTAAKRQTSSAKHQVPNTTDERPASSDEHPALIGQSPQIEEARRQIKRLSHFPGVPVLITGETGTGKEIVANLLHACCNRADKPFIAVNCSAIPEALFESQLFGHRKGAFTGATMTHKGFAEAAQDGTLFLDEISTLKLELQPKLLRLLENGSYMPVGETIERRTNAWIIAATNRRLEELVEKKIFRDDLYYRLKCSEIKLTPLRERPQDILPLATHFVVQFPREHGLEPKMLSSEVEAMLIRYHWPGNVRELRNAMLSLMVGSDEQYIQAAGFPIAATKHQTSALSNSGLTLQDAERIHIQNVLRQNDWRLRKTAKVLGITYVTLRAKLKKYGLSNDT